MTDRTATIEALAVRVEALTGPSYAMECEIHEAIGKIVPSGFAMQYEGARVPNYTASTDAAMSLAPEWWNISQWRIIGKPDSCRIWDDTNDIITSAATPALALTAACLRAIARKEG